MTLIDTHCHLDLYENPVAVALEAQQAGIAVLAVTNAPFVFLPCQKTFPDSDNIFVAVGMHPELVGQYGDQIEDLIGHLSSTRFVGEVGLDYRVTDPSTHARQRTVFEQIVAACSERSGKVMTVHSRGAEPDVANILARRGHTTAILHWYTGAIKYLKQAQDSGCYFSVNMAMLTSKNGRKLIDRMSRSRVLLETDGPYTKSGSRRSKPSDLSTAVVRLAEFWAVDPEHVRSTVMDNWRRALG